jgi:hypothetical protein
MTNSTSRLRKRKRTRRKQEMQPRRLALVFRPLRSSPGPIKMHMRNKGWWEVQMGLLDTNGDIPCVAQAVVWGYKRKISHKEIKVVCQIPVFDGMSTEHPDVHLTRYNWIFAIDTNTRIILNKSISVSCVLGGRAVCLPEQDGPASYEYSFVPVLYYEFWDQVGKPETLAWEFLIKDLVNDPTACKEDMVAIIVDSELGKLQSINDRSVSPPSTPELPNNYYLIYASADAQDFVINKLFRHCDRMARNFFSTLEARYIKSGLPAMPSGTPLLRVWEFPDGIRTRICSD